MLILSAYLMAISSALKGLGLFFGNCFVGTGNILDTKAMIGASADEEHFSKSLFSFLVISGKESNLFCLEHINLVTLMSVKESGEGSLEQIMFMTQSATGNHCENNAFTCCFGSVERKSLGCTCTL